MCSSTQRAPHIHGEAGVPVVRAQAAGPRCGQLRGQEVGQSLLGLPLTFPAGVTPEPGVTGEPERGDPFICISFSFLGSCLLKRRCPLCPASLWGPLPVTRGGGSRALRPGRQGSWGSVHFDLTALVSGPQLADLQKRGVEEEAPRRPLAQGPACTVTPLGGGPEGRASGRTSLLRLLRQKATQPASPSSLPIRGGGRG